MIVQCTAESIFSKGFKTRDGEGNSKIEDFDMRVKSKGWWDIASCVGVAVEVLHHSTN